MSRHPPATPANSGGPLLPFTPRSTLCVPGVLCLWVRLWGPDGPHFQSFYTTTDGTGDEGVRRRSVSHV